MRCSEGSVGIFSYGSQRRAKSVHCHRQQFWMEQKQQASNRNLQFASRMEDYGNMLTSAEEYLVAAGQLPEDEDVPEDEQEDLTINLNNIKELLERHQELLEEGSKLIKLCCIEARWEDSVADATLCHTT